MHILRRKKVKRSVFYVPEELRRRGGGGWEMGFLDFVEADDEFDGIHENLFGDSFEDPESDPCDDDDDDDV